MAHSLTLTFRPLRAASAALLFATAMGSWAQAAPPTTDRIVLKLKPGKTLAQVSNARRSALRIPAGEMQMGALNGGAGVSHVLPLAKPLSTLVEVQTLARQLAADPAVERAEPDYRVRILATAPVADSRQWPLTPATSTSFSQTKYFGSARFESAWPMSTGKGIVIAVVDSGHVEHPQLTNKVIMGYDFVSDTAISADGDARDMDPSDPGDYCGSDNSSWHGVQVTGILAASQYPSTSTGQPEGLVGAAPEAKILQVRALGRCGGYLSDTADAIMWAAGVAVSGAPVNTSPARVINLSMGGNGTETCPAYLQDAINAARARGAVIVAAAGNDAHTDLGFPAGCNGVIAVAASTIAGDLASYSNRSARVDISAPGGGACESVEPCGGAAIYTLGNAGTKGPAFPLSTVAMTGTSVATPHVAAAAALLLSVKPTLTADEVRTLLRANSRAFAQGSLCDQQPAQCGAGLLDVTAAVTQLMGISPLTLSLVAPSGRPVPASRVALSANASGGLAPYAYSWRVMQGPASILGTANAQNIVVSAPRKSVNPAQSPAAALELTVTDQMGTHITERLNLNTDTPPTVSPPTEVNLSEGQSSTYNLDASDADRDALNVIALDGLPAWASLGVVEGKVVLTVASAKPGSFNVRFVVTADGAEAPESTVRLVVAQAAAAAAPPVNSSPPATPAPAPGLAAAPVASSGTPSAGASSTATASTASTGNSGGGGSSIGFLLGLLLATVALRASNRRMGHPRQSGSEIGAARLGVMPQAYAPFAA